MHVSGPWWAFLVVWGITNAVNVLQAAGFVSRAVTGERALNHALGFGIMAMAAPATIAVVGFGVAGAGWLAWLGPSVFLAFLALLIVVDYVRPVEFREPARSAILVPYLVLFYGAILAMGFPMFLLDRRLWLVTVGTTALHLMAMGLAVRREDRRGLRA